MVTTEDGVLLDQQTVEIDEKARAIGFRVLNTTMSDRGDEQELIIGSDHWKTTRC